jgi:hypothetical protein
MWLADPDFGCSPWENGSWGHDWMVEGWNGSEKGIMGVARASLPAWDCQISVRHCQISVRHCQISVRHCQISVRQPLQWLAVGLIILGLMAGDRLGEPKVEAVSLPRLRNN